MTMIYIIDFQKEGYIGTEVKLMDKISGLCEKSCDQ